MYLIWCVLYRVRQCMMCMYDLFISLLCIFIRFVLRVSCMICVQLIDITSIPHNYDLS